jgi:hypothetical protein
MKFISHVPLFTLILIIYNLALFVHRDAFKDQPAVQPVAQQTTPAAAVEPVAAPEPGDAAAAPAESATVSATAEAAAPAPSAPAPAPAPAAKQHPLDKPMFSLTLPSGAKMPVSPHEFLLVLAVALLYIELFKSTKTGTATIVEHVFSLLVFMAFFVELLMYPPAGHPVFLVITALAFLDVVAGFTITISTARRDFGLGGHADQA